MTNITVGVARKLQTVEQAAWLELCGCLSEASSANAPRCARQFD